MTTLSRRLERLGFWSVLVSTAIGLGTAEAAQPVYGPPYVVQPNILYVIPYAVSTQPVSPAGAPVFPDAETVITIASPRQCLVQVEWVDWNGAVVGHSGAPTPPPPVAPAGALEYTTQQKAPAIPLPPFVLNVFSDVPAAFEGHANIRSNCTASTRLKIDAGLVEIPAAGGLPQYKPIPVIRPTGLIGD